MAKGLPYNGWSALVRHGRDKHYYHAQRNKILPQSAICTCCQIELPIDCIPYHQEEYGPALEDCWASSVPLCHRCHAMLHARFVTPNRWKHYLGQALSGAIDDGEYPPSKNIAPMLSRFKSRKDISFVPMPESVPSYFSALSFEEYSGPSKLATLKVIDQANGNQTEVPDWTLYGENLELLTTENRRELNSRGIDVQGFLLDKIKVTRNKVGKRVYKRLYV